MVHLTRGLIVGLCLAALLCACPSTALAQISISGYNISAYSQEKIGEKRWRLAGAVELERNDTRIYADSIEYFEDEERAVASGNVVVTQGESRIAADRADFSTRTQLGTFYHASGIARVRQPQRRPTPGAIAPPLIQNQENDVYYFGEKVEKLGAKKYRITNGGFSTCVQPTPRWDLTAGTIVLNIDHYTLLRQMLLNVKGVPMLYLPIFYYPTKEDERATGFLIPTYGASTLRGQTIHNAFFWAINRSQDATFLHDWFSKTGTGTGAEYRYNRGGGSDGQMSGYLLDQREASYVQSDGSVNTQGSARSFMLNGIANQTIAGRFRARGRMDYFSSLRANQTFNTNVNSAARNQRSYGANVVGAFRGFALNATFERTEWFQTTTASAVTGSSPRVLLSRSERPLFRGSPVYFGLTSEYAGLDRQTRSNGVVIDDRSLRRMDFNPQIRYPFKRWTFFSVNTTLGWRDTYYTRSLDPTLGIVDSGINRQYVTMTAQVIGPSFVKVWDTPKSGYAERFKHTIEPYLNIQRTSSISAFDRIIKLDGVDNIVGNTTSLSYGVHNRIYAKRRIGQTSRAQEILAIEVNQTYYTDARQSQLDPRYATNSGTVTAQAPNKFSPIAVIVRATPGATVNGNARAEIDSRYLALRTVSATGAINWRQQVQSAVTWSRRFLIPELPPFNNPANLDHYVNLSTTLQTTDRRYGTIFSMNYDFRRSVMLQQRVSGFYNAQCCGIAFEFQRFNFGGIPSYVIPADNRFFLSFTLAGLGNFSPFSGGLGAVPR